MDRERSISRVVEAMQMRYSIPQTGNRPTLEHFKVLNGIKNTQSIWAYCYMLTESPSWAQM